jgi:hypothetical protein
MAVVSNITTMQSRYVRLLTFGSPPFCCDPVIALLRASYAGLVNTYFRFFNIDFGLTAAKDTTGGDSTVDDSFRKVWRVFRQSLI